MFQNINTMPVHFKALLVHLFTLSYTFTRCSIILLCFVDIYNFTLSSIFLKAPFVFCHCHLIIPHVRTESSESVKTVTVTQTQLTSPETVRLPAAQPKQETRTQARIAQQLEEVRLGIFKLLSESDDEAAAEKVVHVKVESEEAKNFTELGVSPLEAEEETPGYQADEEEEEEDSGSQSVEISSSCAQGGAGLAMGCVSGDKEERDSRAEDRATDSGIDRGQGSSRAASAEGWLARLTSRVRHSSPGSTPDLNTRHR